METHARKLAQDLQRLSGELGRFQTDFAVLGKHLRNAAGSYDEGAKRLDKFEARLGSLVEPETDTAPALPGSDISS